VPEISFTAVVSVESAFYLISRLSSF